MSLTSFRVERTMQISFRVERTMQIVELSRNLLEFNLSKVEFPFPKSLMSLDLNHNKIFGSILVG
jgi:hypothetical protein